MKPAFLFFALLCLSTCGSSIEYSHKLGVRVEGLVFTGPGRGPLQSQMFSSMADVGANFVAVVPEATVYRQNLKVVYDFENQWYGEKKQASLEGIALARAQGLKVMLKPHLTIGWDMTDWQRPRPEREDSLSRYTYAASARSFISTQESRVDGQGSWRGEFMTSDEYWPVFESGYEAFILDYARIADSLNVELFCIGTEMKRVALEKPEFFSRLILKVRSVYSGAITYAANWDSYDKIAFWNELDYIGVDAYFPLSESEKPKEEELQKAWQPYVRSLGQLADRYGKAVLFTEWGYENEYYVAREPWVMGRYQESPAGSNENAQVLAYEAMFNTIWNEEWMKGVFVWRWSPQQHASGRPDYSPRGKAAAETLSRWFK